MSYPHPTSPAGHECNNIVTTALSIQLAKRNWPSYNKIKEGLTQVGTLHFIDIFI